MPGLTEVQIKFLENLKIPKVFGREEMQATKQAWTTEFRKFNENREAVRGRVLAVIDPAFKSQLLGQIAQAETIIMRDTKAPDFVGGHAQLIAVNEAVKTQKLYEDCKAEVVRIMPLVEGVMSTQPANADDIVLRRDFVNDRYAKGKAGGGADDFRAVIAACLKLQEELNAATAKEAAKNSGVVDEAKDGLKRAEAMRAPLAALQHQNDRFVELQSKLTAAFGVSMPVVLDSQLDPIQAALATEEDAEPNEVTDAAKAATPLIDKLELDAKPLIEGKAQYEDARAKLLQGPYGVLAGHPQVVDPIISAPLGAINAKLQAAAVAATRHDYARAKSEIAAAAEQTTDAIARADDVAEFYDVRDDREERMAPILAFDINSTPHKQVRDAVRNARNLWRSVTDAFASKSLDRIKATAPDLDTIPQAVADAQKLIRLGGEYDSTKSLYEAQSAIFENAISSFDPQVKTSIQTQIDGYRDHIAASDVAATGDLKVSCTLLAKIDPYWALIDAKIKEVATYNSARTAFDARRKEITDHSGDPGYVAVVDYANRLSNDDAHAASRLLQGEFAMAARVLDASKPPLHDEKKELLLKAGEYFTKRQAVDTELVNVQSLPRQDAAADMIAAVQALVTEAHNARLAPDWDAAVRLIDAAAHRLAVARQVAENAKVMDDNSDPAAIAGMDADTVAAFASYDQVFSTVHAVGADAGDFAGMAAEANALRDQAQLAVPGDFKTAKQHLTEAVAKCHEIIKLLRISSDFKAQLQELKSVQADIVNNSWNVDNYYNTEVNQIATLLSEAESDAQPPGFAFASGMAKLTQARPLADRIYKTADNYIAARDNRATMQSLVDYMNDDSVRDTMGPEISRLTALIAELDNALAVARDPDLAATKAAEGVALDAGYRSTADSCFWYKKYVDETLNPALARLPATRVYSTEERDKIDELQRQIAANVQARAFNAAIKLIFEIESLDLQCRAFEAKGKAYGDAAGPVETRLSELRRRLTAKNGSLDSALTALEERLAAAKAEATRKNYGGALQRVEALGKDIDLVEPQIAAQERCMVARREAGDTLAELGKLPNKTAIEPLVARLRGKYANSVTLCDQGDFATAESTFQAVSRECAEAVKAAAAFSSYTEVADQTSQPDQGDDGLATSLRRAQMFIDDLKGEPEAMFIFADVKKAQTALDAANKLVATDEDSAKDNLRETMDACTQARLALGLYSQLRASETFARGTITTLLTSHPQAGLVREDMEALLGRLDTAMNAVRKDSGQRAQAQSEIEAVMTEFYKLREAADAQIKIAALVADITPRIATMEQHSHRYAIVDDIAAVRQGLESGQALAKEYKHADALRTLQQAKDRQEQALLAAQMQSGAPPDQKAIKELLAKPDGPAALDKMVAGLDAKTQRRVMNEVFEARFGCKLTLYKDGNFVEDELTRFKNSTPPPTKQQIVDKQQELKILDRSQNYDMQPDEKAPDIRRFYELMSKLPNIDTLDNDSLKIFTRKGKGKFPYYDGSQRTGRKEVVMNEMSDSDSSYYGIGQPHELETIDDDCKCERGEDLSYFSWNTLHEVAHAVDDKLGFMDRRGETLAGWKYYGSNVVPVAEKIADHYQFDRDYVAAYMNGNSDPAVPTPLGGVDAEAWERRRADVRAHVDRIREGKNPWQTASSAKASVINGICYQESYGGTWTSYPIAERTKGVSGYQFRAPGEWFAELFAAFHSGKMNKSHPARAWLETLGTS